MTKGTLTKYVLPLHQENPHDIINFFALDNTGLAGQFVSITRSNPSDMSASFAPTSVGAAYDGVTSLRSEVKNKVTPAPTGSTKYQVLGMTLDNTLEVDANGINLRYDENRKRALGAVVSGEAVRITTNGVYMLRSGAFRGTPVVGHVGIISEVPGVVTVVNPDTIAPRTTGAFWNETHVIGKFVSATGGSAFGSSYALFKITL